MQRLSKILAQRGIDSRRKCEKIIEEKRVKVNGVLITKPQEHFNEDEVNITLDNKPLKSKEKKVYFLLNKPKGYVCTNTKTIKKRVIDLFKDIPYRLFSVGRLDKDTKGLLIVTNDGNFAHKVIHPSSNIEKEYLVKTSENISHSALLEISKEAFIEGKWIKPTFVKKVRKNTLKIGVKEGKKHEVRILVLKVTKKIIELKRIRIGPLVLGNIKEGLFRELSPKEIKQFL